VSERFVCGVDIGGTFTDVVLVSTEGRRVTGKADTNRADLSASVLNAVGNATSNLVPRPAVTMCSAA
jgi:N-methylhydantoinase A/oxoprolinase/acetone carboxylase beta subunit